MSDQTPGPAGEEQVQLYDDQGRPAGTAPRSVMRASNLTHSATGIVLLDPDGRIYVHRRTDTKDVYPGRYDFCAGGVLAAGEDPDAGAARELAEELGVTGVPLTKIGFGRYADANTEYWGHLYVARWDGTGWDGVVTWQPEEVVWGDWWTPEELIAHLDDPDWPVMPDSAALLGDFVRSLRGMSY